MRLKRKVELIQAKKNRQEKIVLKEIEKTLDAEFLEFQKKLDEQINRMKAAIERSHCDVLSDEETADKITVFPASRILTFCRTSWTNTLFTP